VADIVDLPATTRFVNPINVLAVFGELAVLQ